MRAFNALPSKETRRCEPAGFVVSVLKPEKRPLMAPRPLRRSLRGLANQFPKRGPLLVQCDCFLEKEVSNRIEGETSILWQITRPAIKRTAIARFRASLTRQFSI
jgi:hypothetical protein